MDSTWTRRKSFYHKLAKMPWCEVVHNVFFWSLHITSIKVTFSSSTSERIWHRLLPSLCHCHIYVDVEPEHSAKLTKCNKSTTLLNIFCDKKIEQKLHKEWKGYTVIRITQYTQVADVEDTMHSISISMGDKIADCTWCLIFLSFFSFFLLNILCRLLAVFTDWRKKTVVRECSFRYCRYWLDALCIMFGFIFIF